MMNHASVLLPSPGKSVRTAVSSGWTWTDSQSLASRNLMSQGKTWCSGSRVSQEARAFVFHELSKGTPGPRTGSGDASVQRVVADFPRLAVACSGCERLAEHVAEAPASPNHGSQKRIESKRAVQRFSPFNARVRRPARECLEHGWCKPSRLVALGRSSAPGPDPSTRRARTTPPGNRDHG